MSDPTSEMKLAVMGAGGRMGAALIRAIHETPNAVLVAAIDQEGAPSIGQDSGTLSGIGENGIAISSDLEAGLDACIQVIGTTGCTEQEDAEIAKSGENATIIKSGNMSLGINLLAVLVEQAASALQAADFDLEVFGSLGNAPQAQSRCTIRHSASFR